MIVITAPTGAIGHQVLENVLHSGGAVRVIARDPARLPAHVRERVEVVNGSHGDIDVVNRAFAGADAVFWLVPPDPKAKSVQAAYVGVGKGMSPSLAPRTCPSTTWRKSCPRVLGNPVRFQQIPFEVYQARFVELGMSEAMAQGMTDMAAAKNQGLDNAEPRTPENTTPTSFRQWSKTVLKPNRGLS